MSQEIIKLKSGRDGAIIGFINGKIHIVAKDLVSKNKVRAGEHYNILAKKEMKSGSGYVVTDLEPCPEQTWSIEVMEIAEVIWVKIDGILEMELDLTRPNYLRKLMLSLNNPRRHLFHIKNVFNISNMSANNVRKMSKELSDVIKKSTNMIF